MPGEESAATTEGPETPLGDPRDAEIAELRRQLAGAQAVDAAAVEDKGAPDREDRAPVLSVDEMAQAMKPAALARAGEVNTQKSMRQMEWAGELATSGPPRMNEDADLNDRVSALEDGIGRLARTVDDLPAQIVAQLLDAQRQQSSA